MRQGVVTVDRAEEASSHIQKDESDPGPDCATGQRFADFADKHEAAIKQTCDDRANMKHVVPVDLDDSYDSRMGDHNARIEQGMVKRRELIPLQASSAKWLELLHTLGRKLYEKVRHTIVPIINKQALQPVRSQSRVLLARTISERRDFKRVHRFEQSVHPALPQPDAAIDLTDADERTSLDQEVDRLGGASQPKKMQVQFLECVESTPMVSSIKAIGPSDNDVAPPNASHGHKLRRRQPVLPPNPFEWFPPDIRNPIWAMTVTHDHPLIITNRRTRSPGVPQLVKKRNRRHLMALLWVNRQMRNESMGFFFSQNSFRIQDRAIGITDGHRMEDTLFANWSRSFPSLAMITLRDIDIRINLYRRPTDDEHFRFNLIGMLCRLRKLCAEYPSVQCSIEFGQITCSCGNHETIEVGDLPRSRDFTVPVELANLPTSIDASASRLKYRARIVTDNCSCRVLRFARNRLSSLASAVRQLS